MLPIYPRRHNGQIYLEDAKLSLGALGIDSSKDILRHTIIGWVPQRWTQGFFTGSRSGILLLKLEKVHISFWVVETPWKAEIDLQFSDDELED